MEEKTRPYSPALSIVLSIKTITTDTSMKCPADDAGLTKGRAKSTLCPIRLVDISQLLELKYNTGDHIAVWLENKDAGIIGPHNHPRTARGGLDEALGDHWPLELVLRPSLHALFKHHIEIAAPVSRELILNLVHGNNYIVVRAPGDIGKGDVIYGGGKQFSPTREANITDDSVINEDIATFLHGKSCTDTKLG
ncbi:unnamed protein product [Clonostachys chloroleuca]|uniref:Uncharacterized protein n=1 Tax=Clonostachys chloroleuca TaxID=1926264 RepID=A0AA35LRI8_9HYPO|nr:unnamed protein product [Clonostachys chloroleuca]CAI6041887.1 unnamed protein product [Clonostachys chloroleuca]CAI6095928.1 unnamed protein product [Clonostachys chloroleuca]